MPLEYKSLNNGSFLNLDIEIMIELEKHHDQKLDYSNDAPEMTDVKCREAVGSLIYFTTCKHPDPC